ncbi:Intra-flagellar transport protein 57 [Carpediemonas membranifera]|uniref:Intra-flagellar transport protein 57 n=1 Tax=Carpediemonas membranifera TaxID=201153 RepID=A0A8J6E6I4_9EUKA|nr:Intra-flagellar transport protein 57 [Carpediemonas membranifera]|eukprot:KAG9397147.1 Intra-flagellar transport protein 57 [Carpediemonas membranifera]
MDIRTLLQDVMQISSSFSEAYSKSQYKLCMQRPGYFVDAELYIDSLSDPRYNEFCALCVDMLRACNISIPDGAQAAAIISTARSNGIALNVQASAVEQGTGKETERVIQAIAAHLLDSHEPVDPGCTIEEDSEANVVDDLEDDDDDLDDLDDLIEEEVTDEAAVQEDQHRVTEAEWHGIVGKRRLAAALRTPLYLDPKNWRTSIHAIMSNAKNLSDAGRAVGDGLERLAQTVAGNDSNIAIREHFLASQLTEEVARCAELQKRFTNVSEEAQVLDSEVGEITAALNKLTSTLDDVKMRIHERSDLMSDTTPLSEVKRAVHELQEEVRAMDQQLLYYQSMFLRNLKR